METHHPDISRRYPRVRHSNAKMEAILVCGSMENGGMFCSRHGPWIFKKGGVFGSQHPWIYGKLHGMGGKIVSDRLAWPPFFHQSAVPGRYHTDIHRTNNRKIMVMTLISH